MVNPLTPSAVSSSPLVDAARHQGAPRTDALGRPVPASQDNVGAVSTTISRLAAGGPPLDTNRIETLRAAIKAGTYRVDPHAIADRMVDSDMPGAGGGIL